MLDHPGQWLTYVWTGWIATWPTEILTFIWLAWVTSWVVASYWSARTDKQMNRELYLVSIIAGAVLIAPWTGHALGEKSFLPFGNVWVYFFAALTVGGMAFAWWGRIYLGSLWSNGITRKENHHVVDTGPYGLVRHPIYTGQISAILFTGIAVATITSLLGAVLIALGLWQKARLEERFLTEELGEQNYGAYCRRVPMLIPFLPQR